MCVCGRFSFRFFLMWKVMIHRIDQHTPTRHTQSHTRTTTRQMLSLLNPIEIACLARVSRHYRFFHISCVCLALPAVLCVRWGMAGRARLISLIYTHKPA